VQSLREMRARRSSISTKVVPVITDCRLTFRASESVIGARTADGERYLALLRTA
jgi:hypothetical protein